MNQWTLRFADAQTEKEFNDSCLEQEVKVFRYSLILGILTYLVFLPLDFVLYGERLLKNFIILRISISIIIIIAFVITYKIRTTKQYQILALFTSLLSIMTSIIFSFFDDIEPFYFYTGNIIIIAFVYNLLNIRFFYLIFASMVFIFLHLFTLSITPYYTVELFTHQAYGIISVVIVSLISVRVMESQKREDFINKRLIESQKIALEKSVSEKDDLLVMLKERNEELDTFNHSVSHDLKTPLRNINSFSKLLERRYKNQLDENGLEYLDFIVNGTAKMNMLIDDLLEYSKIRHTELNIEMLNMNQIVEGVFLEFSQSMSEKPELVFDDLPNIKGDKILIKQVWDNLISNAVKYSSKSKKSKIKISSTTNNTEIIYCIQDNGVGFDMKFANRLFELFSRLHSDNEYIGTGVGLSLVDRIIKKHNGKIWAESVPEEGSIFYFSLPII